MTDTFYLIIYRDSPLDPRTIMSGAEMATLYLAKFLTRAGKSVVVAAQLKDVEITIDGVEYWDLGPDYDTGAALARAAQRGNFHLICPGRALAILQSKGLPECRSRILITHDRAAGDSGIAPKILEQRCDKIVCVSRAQEQLFLEAGVSSEKVAVVPNGVDFDIFTAPAAANRDLKKLVFVGALVPDKGVHLLLKAYAQLVAKIPGLSLDVYGSASLWGRGDYLDFAALARDLPGVCFHGKKPAADIAHALRSAGVCVIPSIWFDPFPLVSLEAQAAGCPVVVTDVGGLAEGVRQGETGIVLPEISEAALAKTLEELLKNPERLQRMSQAAAAHIRSQYRWEDHAGRISGFSEAAATKTSGTSPRVGFLSTWNQECGLATYARFLLSEYAKDSYVIFAEQHQDKRTAADEANVIRCWKRGAADFQALRQAIRDQKVEILHLNCQYTFFPQPAFAEFLKEIRADGIRVVAQIHSTFNVNPQLSTFISSVDQAIVHTEQNKLELVAAGGEAARIAVVPHGVLRREALTTAERQAVRHSLGIPDNTRLLLSFGFIQPHKGMEGLIEAVAKSRAAGIAAHGAICGMPLKDDPNSEQYLRELRAYAERLGVTAHVTFAVGFATDERIVELCSSADVVIMNYQSQYFESSGACSLAVGAGAAIVTSLAPGFFSFGDAVFQSTAGFPVGEAVGYVLARPELAKTLRDNAARYARANDWAVSARRMRKIYAVIENNFKCSTASVKISEGVVNTYNPLATGTPGEKLKVLIQNRPHAFTHFGGDTTSMQRIAERLPNHGASVTIDLEGKENPAHYDIVHLFNFATPDITKAYAQKAHAAGVPYVVHTLYEDIPRFHHQSHAVAASIIEYVRRGQDKTWYAANKVDVSKIKPCDRFENEWTAEHAAALFTAGPRESQLLRREFPRCAETVDVYAGCEITASHASPDAFIREYGERDFVLCVGRLETRKNQLMLLKALEDSEMTVVLATSGVSYQPEYDAAVKAFKRKGKTLILPHLSTDMLASAYMACKIHVLPSWYELPGQVSLEAAHYGKNIVVTDEGTPEDIFGNAAFYCEPWNEKSIRAAVDAAYYSPVKSELKTVVSRFSWDRIVADVYATYCRIVNAKRQQGQGFAASQQPITMTPPAADSALEMEIKQADEAAQSGNIVRAHQIVAGLEGRYPNNARVLRARGVLFLAEQNVASAQDYLRRALAADPKDLKSLTAMGLAESQAKNHQAAYKYFMEALNIDPTEKIATVKLIECSYMIGRFDDLERILRKHLQHAPQDLDLKYSLAGCLFKLGKNAEAITLNQEVLLLKPQHEGARELQNRLNPAPATMTAPPPPQQTATTWTPPREWLATAVPAATPAPVATPVLVPQSTMPPQSSFQPPPPQDYSRPLEDVETQIALMEEAKRQRNSAAAKEISKQLLSRPMLSAQHRERIRVVDAECTVLEGRTDEGEAIYNEILSQNPTNDRALCGKGAISASRGEWNDARRLFEQALTINPRSDIAHAGLGMADAQISNFEGAWKHYQQARGLNSENVRALLGLIELGYSLKRLPEVEAALQEYLELHPADLDFVYALAGCFFAQNKFDQASEQINRITLFNPTHERALELRGMIAVKRGSETRAAV